MGLKVLVIVAIIFAAVGYMCYESLPETIASPWKFRARRLGEMAFMWVVKLQAALTGKNEWVVVRDYFKMVFKPALVSTDELEIVKTEDTKFEGIPVRIYQPKTRLEKLPGLIYFHGGAFVIGDVSVSDKLMRDLVKDINLVVVFVSYRLAPENKYPAAYEDCLQATKYFMQKAHTFDVDPSRIGVAGDSAGGNLAAVVALKLRDIQWKPQLRTQLLLYPVLQACNDHLPVHAMLDKMIKLRLEDWRALYLCTTDDEYHIFNTAKKHITPQLEKLCDKYVSDKYIPKDMIPEDYKKKTNPNIGESPAAIAVSKKISDPYVFPLMAPNLSNLPKAYVFTVEIDALRDDGIVYAMRMQEDGVKVDWVHFDNTTHGILNYYDDETYVNAYQRLVLYLKFNL